MENWEKVLEELFTGVMGMSDPTVWVMFAIGAVLIWLGVKKDYEPMLLSLIHISEPTRLS